MKALTVVPGERGSLAVTEVPDPQPGDAELLVDAIALGVCGTDKEIVAGSLGSAPPGEQRLVLGHESLGRVRAAPEGSGFDAGDLVVAVVRRPDPVPCGACARGEFDMCRNGEYVERGIKQVHGFGSEQWTVPPEYAVRLDPALEGHGVLLEPTSVVAKAWEQVEAIGSRAYFDPRTVLVTGSGPIGLLAALLGHQRGLDVHVLDVMRDGPKPDLVRDLGATYHHDLDKAFDKAEPDIVIEATGAPPVVLEAISRTTSYGVVCLAGVSGPGRRLQVDAGSIDRDIVPENAAVFGTINANLRHYRSAADALSGADAGWLGRLVTRRVPLDAAAEAFESHDDVKVVLTFD